MPNLCGEIRNTESLTIDPDRPFAYADIAKTAKTHRTNENIHYYRRGTIGRYQFFVSGCSTTPEPSKQTATAQMPQNKEVQIITDPAGAHIEYNDNYIGDAPLTIQVPQIVTVILLSTQ